MTRARDILACLVLFLCCAALWFVPPPRPLAAQEGVATRARVISVDNSLLETHGYLRFGTQRLDVELLAGPKKGQVFHAANELRAQMELDKLFRPGDTALVIVRSGDESSDATLVARDHWRLGWAGGLFAAFCLLLCAFGGWTGAKALFSFVFSCFVVWKGVIPLALRGWPASWTAFAATCLLTAVIMYLVAGPTRKGLAAFLGATLGVFAGLAMAHVFGRLMHINGTTLPYAPALLNSGYEFLDLPDVFIGAMVLASSGAVMDLAMDIASGVEEVATAQRVPARARAAEVWPAHRAQRDGNDDDHAAAGLLGRVPDAPDGVRGSGHGATRLPELDARLGRAREDAHRQLFARPRGTVHGACRGARFSSERRETGLNRSAVRTASATDSPKASR